VFYRIMGVHLTTSLKPPTSMQSEWASLADHRPYAAANDVFCLTLNERSTVCLPPQPMSRRLQRPGSERRWKLKGNGRASTAGDRERRESDIWRCITTWVIANNWLLSRRSSTRTVSIYSGRLQLLDAWSALLVTQQTLMCRRKLRPIFGW